VPYLPILAAGGVAVLRMVDGDGLDAFLVWTGIVAIVLLCVHQIVVLNENHGLTVGLEARVRRRTVELLEREQHFSALVQRSSDVICVLEGDLTIRYVSDSVRRVLGLAPEELVGKAIVDVVSVDDLPPVEALFRQVVANSDRTASAECPIHGPDGAVRFVELTVTNLLHHPAVHGIVVNTRDVTDRRALEDRLRHDAFHDSLTGLANRALLRERTQHAIARSRRTGTHVGVVLMDLDGFKAINDSLGHAVGDDVLVSIGQRLATCVRPGDTVARLGGDEFAFLLEDLERPEEAEAVADRIIDALAQPIEIGARELIVHASVGIAVREDEDPAELLRNADVAMYAAKDNGKAQYRWFEPEMHEQVVTRLAVEADLHRALERGEFEVHYQPTVDLATLQIQGAEALVRWRHPEHGSIGPDRFIAIAEATGIIVPLGTWVLEQACLQVQQWRAAWPDGPPLSVSVNLSARQLQDPCVVDAVADVLRRTGVDPAAVVLEITESLLVKDTELSIARLHELKALGLRLALDDFGTGYSSLRYLQRFPIDVLKVDKSFVDSVHLGSEQSALTRAIVRIGRTLGLTVVAEGIELQEQAMLLRALECHGGQGFLFARPMTAPQLCELLERAAHGEPVFPTRAPAA
jgi:diguanylate cyclase (GGDEF)-like protein/PAS domain S-box-containing protein